jgi:hypothetical protein
VTLVNVYTSPRIIAAGEAYQRAKGGAESKPKPLPAMSDSARQRLPRVPIERPPSLPDRWKAIVAATASRHGITVAELCGRGRKRRCTVARQEALYHIACLPGVSMLKIADRFDRDHTTIRYSLLRHMAENPGCPPPPCMGGCQAEPADQGLGC